MTGFAPRPLVIVWRVTEHCDLACRFCEFSRERAWPRQRADEASAIAFGAVLRDVAAQTGRAVHISFLGGEPLGWAPLRSVASRLKHDYGLSTGLTTNGTRLHLPGMLEHLLNDYDQLTLSVDGAAHWHDAVRRSPGLWNRLRASASQLAARKAGQGQGPLLRANTVLMRSNLHDLEALGRELAAWGIEVLTFNALGGTAGDPFYDRERLRADDIAWLRAALPGLRARLGALGLRLSGSSAYLERLDRQARSVPWPVVDCGPGADFLFIDALGRVGPCDATTGGYGVPMAELCDAADFVRLPRLLAQRRAAHAQPACADCRSTAVFGKFAEAAA